MARYIERTHCAITVYAECNKKKAVCKTLSVIIPIITRIVQARIAKYDNHIVFGWLITVTKIKIPTEITMSITGYIDQNLSPGNGT